MSDWPLLSTVIFLPMIGVLMIMLVNGDSDISRRNIKNVALWTSVVTLLISLLILRQFNPANSGFQMLEQVEWMGASISYRVGIDGISVFFVLLTTVLMPAAIYAGRDAITLRVKEYMIAFLTLETMLIGVFSALDLMLFYIFFEVCIIPVFFIVAIWGGEGRIEASFRFLLHAMAGSVLMLLAIMAIYWSTGTADIVSLLGHSFDARVQIWLWLAFFIAFAVRMPIWPLHSWLPEVHVRAPTAGSVVLSGLLVTTGGYGLLRFCLPMFPLASEFFAPLVLMLSGIAILYGSFAALVQENMKRLIAYASVAQMGFVTLGLFTLTVQGVQGAIILMISHGLVMAALFLCIGFLRDRMNSHLITSYSGLANRMPTFAKLFLIFILAHIGLPGTTGFVGEFLTILSAFQTNSWFALIAGVGVVLSASYGLWLYRRVVLGKLEKESLRSIADLNARETRILVPLAGLVILFGTFPAPLQKLSALAVETLVKDYQAALFAAEKLAALAQ